MSNEMTHMQDFQTRLYEYGFTPAKLRGRFWMVGYVFGLGSRMMGTTGCSRPASGSRARPSSTTASCSGADWDDETRAMIEKDRADEYGHIARWEGFLKAEV